MKGRKALRVEWDEGANAAESTATLRAQSVSRAAEKPGTVLRNDGDVDAVLRNAPVTENNYFLVPKVVE